MFGPMASTWSEVIDGLGGTLVASDGLGQSKSTVSGWRDRGIPAAHWWRVVRLAKSRGRSDISLEALAHLAARKRDAAAEVRA